MTIAFRHTPQTQTTAPNLSVQELAFRMVAAFRAHPHVSNVLTHVSRGDWAGVEQSLQRILDPARTGAELSLLEQNLVDLMHAERGVTGRILRPFLRQRLCQLIEAEQVGEILAKIEILFIQSQRTADPEPSGQEPAVRTTFDLAAS